MRRVVAGAALALLLSGVGAEAGMRRMIVADLPYARVWEAAVKAVEGYPLERAADGVIASGWRERPARAEEPGFERVTERVTLRVERVSELITRVTVEVEAQGWRDGTWVAIQDTTATERAVLARFRDAGE